MPQIGIPYNDTGMLGGGVIQHRAIINNLQADGFRSASQSQSTGQAARSFSGSTVTNTQTQTASLSQDSEIDNTKTVTIGAVLSTNANASDFNNNYLQKYIAGVDAADYLARAAGNSAQDQGSGQSGFGKLEDFSGTDSQAANTLTQNAFIDQRFDDSDLDLTVVNTTSADELSDAFNQARFRSIEANFQDHSAQYITTSGQRQGSASNPLTQVGVSDGAGATNRNGVDNILTQTATIVQGNSNSDADFKGIVDLSRGGATEALTPRGTDLAIRLNELAGVSSAINSAAASQDQVLTQSGAGGTDETGNVTGNGGTVRNQATSTARNLEEDAQVRNYLTVTI
jgi:hypothetical protein